MARRFWELAGNEPVTAEELCWAKNPKESVIFNELSENERRELLEILTGTTVLGPKEINPEDEDEGYSCLIFTDGSAICFEHDYDLAIGAWVGPTRDDVLTRARRGDAWEGEE